MLAVTAALAGGVVVAAPAAAHGQLVAAESTPVEGARIGEPLPALSLTFTETPAEFAYFTVTAPDGTRVDDGWNHGEPFPLATPVQEYNLVDDVWEPQYYSTGFPVDVAVAHWPAAGDYTVTYASVSSDGDVVEGSYVFGYDGPVTQAPQGWTPPTDGPDPQIAAAEGDGSVPQEGVEPAPVDPAPAAAPTVDAAAVPETPQADGPGVRPAVYVLAGLLVLGAVASIAVVTRRGRGGPTVAAGTGPGAGRPAGPRSKAGARSEAGAGSKAGSGSKAGARSGNPAVRAGKAPVRGGSTSQAPRR